MGICTLYSLHAQTNLVLAFFSPYHMFINNDKSTIKTYFKEAIDKNNDNKSHNFSW